MEGKHLDAEMLPISQCMRPAGACACCMFGRTILNAMFPSEFTNEPDIPGGRFLRHVWNSSLRCKRQCSRVFEVLPVKHAMGVALPARSNL